MASNTSNASACSALLIALSVLAATTARAADDATEACLTAHTEGQKARRAGHLLEAKRQFLSCAATSCPDLTKQQCVPWLAEIEQRIPTVVLDVRDDRGRDIGAVRVFIDDQLVTEHLDGRSMPLDPGDHRFRIEARGFAPVAQSFLLREGEQARAIHMKLVSPHAREPLPPEKKSAGIPWPSYVLGGVALLGFAGGTYFFFSGKNDVSDLRSSCAPHCDESDVDSARAKIRAADVLLGVGVVALGAATFIALNHDSPKSSESARRTRSSAAPWPRF
jgi:hypothetical protein